MFTAPSDTRLGSPDNARPRRQATLPIGRCDHWRPTTARPTYRDQSRWASRALHRMHFVWRLSKRGDEERTAKWLAWEGLP